MKKKKKPKKKKTIKYESEVIRLDKAYTSAIDFTYNYFGKLNSIKKSFAFLDKPFYQSNILNAITGFQKEFRSFNAYKPILPETSHLKDLGKLERTIFKSTIGLAALSKKSSIANLAKVIAGGSPEMQNRVIRSTLFSNSYLKDGQIQGITKSLNSLMTRSDLYSLGIQSSLVKASQLNLFAEKSLLSLNWSHLGSKIGMDKNRKLSIQNTFFDFSAGLSGLLKTYESEAGKFFTTNPAFIKIPSVEYFTSSNLIGAISQQEKITSEEEILKTEIQYENEYSLETWLPKLGNGLFDMWKGAIESLHSTNTERVRHFVTSIRELYTHVLHIMAPDDHVLKWTSNMEYIQDGKPTRRARLYYICRNISSDPFSKFVDKDIQATLAFIELFQQGTHSIDPKFSENHLTTVKCKAETSLRFLLEIHFSANT